MKHVERIRERVIRGQMGELVRLRAFISMTGENQEAVDRLHGEIGDEVLARVTDFILQELGHIPAEAPQNHGTAVDVSDSASRARRAVKRTRG